MEKLKILRNKKGLTQQDLSDILHIARSTYAQYELGSREPDYETLKKIAQFYNVSLDYLLENEIKEENAVYNHEQLKKKIVKDLGEDVEIHFYDAKKITDEQLEIIKAIVNMEWNKDKK